MQVFAQEFLRFKGGWVRACSVTGETQFQFQLCSALDLHLELGVVKRTRWTMDECFKVVLETGLDLILAGSSFVRLADGKQREVSKLNGGDTLDFFKGPMPTEWVGGVNLYSDPQNLDLIYSPFSAPKNFSVAESFLKDIYFSTTLVVLEGQEVPEVVIYGDTRVLKKLQRLWLLFGVIATFRDSGLEKTLTVPRSVEVDFVFRCIGLLEVVETKILRDIRVTPFSMFSPIRIKSIHSLGNHNTLSLTLPSGFYISTAGILVIDSPA